MVRKLISISTCALMLLCMGVPALAAANDTGPTEDRSIDDILNEYHEKSFALETAESGTGPAARSNRSGSSGKSPEEETVDELTAAGYEAYHVTSSNYGELETSLNTDFADMGLDPEGSYIIVLTGENHSDQNNPNSRSGIPPEENIGDDSGGGGGSFVYYYGGNSYRMRYLMVTAASNNQLGFVTPVDILNELDEFSVPPIANFLFTAVTSVSDFFSIGTLTSIVASMIPDVEPTYHDVLNYTGGTNWTVTYTQIYDEANSTWTARSSIEYVTMRYFIDYYYYEASTNQYEHYSRDGYYGTSYSENYYSNTWRQEAAVQAFIYGGRMYDTIERVEYKVGSTVVLTHDRWMEHWGYEP